jgi:DNA-directed RNA polymerase subunit M/transcription elongation factor TFIIS
MEFCKECGSRLEPKTVKLGTQVLLVLSCRKCGQKTNDEAKAKGNIITHSLKQMVSVIDKENQLSVLPTIQVACSKCGNNSAYAW